MSEQSACRLCGAPILWVRSQNTDALVPLDQEPVEKGRIALVDGKAVVLRGDLFEEHLEEGPRYQSHFASCPNAVQHGKRKGSTDDG